MGELRRPSRSIWSEKIFNRVWFAKKFPARKSAGNAGNGAKREMQKSPEWQLDEFRLTPNFI